MHSTTRFTATLAVLMVGLITGLFIQGLLTPVMAQRTTLPGSGPTLLMTSSAAADGGQHVVLIDPQDRVISTYHVDGANGGISLRSVRNFRWDVMMDEFNSGEPKPKEIRALLEQQ